MPAETRLTFEEVDAHIEQHFLAEQMLSTSPVTKADIYNIYFVVKPVLGMVSRSFFIPAKWRDAIIMLMQALDALHPCTVATNKIKSSDKIAGRC